METSNREGMGVLGFPDPDGTSLLFSFVPSPSWLAGSPQGFLVEGRERRLSLGNTSHLLFLEDLLLPRKERTR